MLFHDWVKIQLAARLPARHACLALCRLVLKVDLNVSHICAKITV